MIILYSAILVLAVLYCGVCTMLGFGNPGTLADFGEPEFRTDRQFANTMSEVRSAYVDAVRRTPGMRLVESHAQLLFIDMTPTARVLDGNFGFLFVVSFESQAFTDSSATRVRTEARKKVAIARFTKDRPAFTYSERALRMNAKKIGLEELLPEVAAPPAR